MIWIIGPNCYDPKMTEARSGVGNQPHVGVMCVGLPQPDTLERQRVLGTGVFRKRSP
jgi:hypothetical protein